MEFLCACMAMKHVVNSAPSLSPWCSLDRCNDGVFFLFFFLSVNQNNTLIHSVSGTPFHLVSGYLAITHQCKAKKQETTCVFGMSLIIPTSKLLFFSPALSPGRAHLGFQVSTLGRDSTAKTKADFMWKISDYLMIDLSVLRIVERCHGTVILTLELLPGGCFSCW